MKRTILYYIFVYFLKKILLKIVHKDVDEESS